MENHNSCPTIIRADHQGNVYFNHQLVMFIKIDGLFGKLIPILKNANIWNVCDSSGNTLLHIAAKFNNYKLIKYLIRSGSRVDVQNNLEKTPLIIAIENRKQESTKVLLEANANIFISDNLGKNALNWFIDVQWSGQYVLTRMILEKVTIQCLDNSEIIANKLLAAGWPLHYAASLDNLEVMKIMLERGCRVDESDAENGRTALHVAVTYQYVKHVKLFLDNNADPNAEDKLHKTPLSMIYDDHLLLRNGRQASERVEMVKLLIDRGAALVTRTVNASLSRVNCLLIYGNRRVIEILLQANLAQLLNNQEENNFPVHLLAWNTNEGVFKALAGYTFDVESRDYSGHTPLITAAARGNLVAVEFFLQRGADVNAITNNGYSTIYTCVDIYLSFKAQHKECIQLLLEHGADVSLQASTVVPTVFDIVQANEQCMPVAELLLAHVALHNALGVYVDECIYRKIHSHPTFDDYYNFCMRQLVSELYKSVTLLDLFKVGDIAFERYLRNEELTSNIERFNDQWQVRLYYFNALLQKRYYKAVQVITLRKEAICCLCKIIKTDYYRHPLIADQIVSYLDKRDLQKLLLVLL